MIRFLACIALTSIAITSCGTSYVASNTKGASVEESPTIVSLQCFKAANEGTAYVIRITAKDPSFNGGDGDARLFELKHVDMNGKSKPIVKLRFYEKSRTILAADLGSHLILAADESEAFASLRIDERLVREQPMDEINGQYLCSRASEIPTVF